MLFEQIYILGSTLGEAYLSENRSKWRFFCFGMKNETVSNIYSKLHILVVIFKFLVELASKMVMKTRCHF